jgi:hypothetical protein
MQIAIADTQPFTICYQEMTLKVVPHIVGGVNTIYHVVFPDNTPDLKLFRASGMVNPKFWTSIPEDLARVTQSEEIGNLIFAHYNPVQ